MSGPSLLAEFFSAGFSLVVQFFCHPVTVGAIILGVPPFVLTFVIAIIQEHCENVQISSFLDSVDLFCFVVGMLLLGAFLLWGLIYYGP